MSRGNSDSDSWSIISKEVSDDDSNASDDEDFMKIGRDENDKSKFQIPKPSKKELATRAILSSNGLHKKQQSDPKLPPTVIAGPLEYDEISSTTAPSNATDTRYTVFQGSQDDSHVGSLKRKCRLVVPMRQEENFILPNEPNPETPRAVGLQPSVSDQFVKEKVVGGRFWQTLPFTAAENSFQSTKETQVTVQALRQAVEASTHRELRSESQTVYQRGAEIPHSVSSITNGLNRLRWERQNTDPLLEGGLSPQLSGSTGTQNSAFYGPPAGQPTPFSRLQDTLSQLPKIVGPTGQATAPQRPSSVELESNESQIPNRASVDPTNPPTNNDKRQPRPH